ncbi:apolipoprotein D-like [Macrobrachium rosenbergii]|uniref:apolipoprotein D-like n=1 Tax=Macrobrachium rosenbergii TaxID=79674 RepID=UPI0034D78D97
MDSFGGVDATRASMQQWHRLNVIASVFLVMVLNRMTTGQVFFRGPCPNIQPLKGFQPKRFLGRWYEIERFFVSYEGLAGTCWVENYLFKRGRGHFTRLDWKDHLSGMILNIENGITFDKKEPGRLRYVVERPSIPILQGEYLILATDYHSYALAWQCMDFPLSLGHTEILWFLSKDQFPSYETEQTAKRTAAKLGLDISRLEKQDRSRCPE